MRRVEDSRLLTGKGKFLDDISIPGELYLGVVRSPYPRAKFRLGGGPRYLFSWRDISKVAGPFPNFFFKDSPQEHVVEREEAKYFGDPVALVLSRDRYGVEDALEEVEVDWEPLEPVTDPLRAEESDPVHPGRSNLVYQDRFTYGELSPGGDSVQKTFRYPRLSPSPIEPNAVLAHYTPQGLTVYANTQVPQVFRTALSIILSLPRSRIRIVVPDSGGGFGGKIFLRPLVMASVASMISGRPVKYLETRTEHMIGGVQGPDRHYSARLYYTGGGKLRGIEVEQIEDFGAYLHTYQPLPILRQIYHLAGAYDLQWVDFRVRGVLTNKPPTGPYRGLGIPPAVLVLENLVSTVGRRTGLGDRVRDQNFLRGLPKRTITGAVYDSGDYASALSFLLQEISRAPPERPGKLRGKGVAFALEPGSSLAFQTLVVPKSRTPYYEGASVKVESGGDVTVTLSTNSMGTGHETSITQVVADLLGVTPEEVNVVLGDTSGPPGTGFYGSRFSVVGVSAVYRAASAVREKIIRNASRILNVEVRDISLEEGWILVRGERVMRIRDVANASYNSPNFFDPLVAEEVWNSPNAEVADEDRRVNFSSTYGVNAHGVILDIDKETGFLEVVKYVVVSDCGNMINPMVVDGQIHGGTVMGIGGTLMEYIDYGDGYPSATNFSEYAILSALESPNVVVLHQESPSPFTPLGTKGVAEGGTTVPAAAIVNALEDALGREIPHIELPLTPERVRSLLEMRIVNMG